MGLLQVLNLPAPSRTAETTVSATEADDRVDTPRVVPKAPPKQVAGPAPSGGSAAPPDGSQPPRAPQQAPSARPQGVPALSPQAIEYANKLQAVRVLLAALNAHPEARSIARDLAGITSKLASAGGHATAGTWDAALRDAEAARLLCETAKTNAENWKTFRAKKASVAAMGTALEGLVQSLSTDLATAVSNAQTEMDKSPPAYAAAMRLLNDQEAAALPTFRADVKAHKDRLAALEAASPEVKRFLDAEITAGRKQVADLEAALAAQDWSRVYMIWRECNRLMNGANRHAARRGDYETQRAKTIADIAAVKAVPAVANRGATLDQQLQEADRLASRDVMKMEEGAAALVKTTALCKALVAVAPKIVQYGTDRAKVDADLLALDRHAAAAQLADQRKAIAAVLALAAAQAAQGANLSIDPTPRWTQALAQLDRAKTDLAAAQQLATSLGPGVAATAAAAGGDTVAMTQALAALKADLAKATGAADASAGAKPFKRAAGQAEDAEKALAKGKAKDAARHLREAGAALAEGRTLQAELGRHLADLAEVERQLLTLQGHAKARLVAPRIQAVEKAVKEAQKASKGGEGTDARAALRVASDLLPAAKQALDDRDAYDLLARKASDRIDADIADPKDRKPFAKLLADAEALAAKLDFVGAQGALKKLHVAVGKRKLEAGMKASPPDPKLKDIVKDMVANGGAGAVDKAIQDSPAAALDVIADLATARFGKDFKFKRQVDNLGAFIDDPANMVKAMKACCAMFAKISDDVVDNPSISDITHEDAQGSAGGGYSGSSAKITMNGRLGIPQAFGNAEEFEHPQTGRMVKALPDNIDPTCKPAKGGSIEYMGFAAAHEVGHGVDDLRGFMKKNGSQERYGGWIDHGGNVQPIADAVGPSIKGKHPASTFYDTAESRQYVLDKLMNRPSKRPPAATLNDPAFVAAEFAAYEAFDKWHGIATSDDVYRRQGDCDAIKLGTPARIYHEAYKRRWVSYLASARSKGMTGYQFRAPGEWFAELYACWKSGKLGSKHPALEWLTKL